MQLQQHSGTPSTSDHWYAIHTKPLQDERAEQNLRAWGRETYAPRLWVGSSKLSTRAADSSMPLFPRYIFARFDPESMYHKVMYTRGVSSVVTFGGVPAPIADEIIDLIKSREQDGFVRLAEEFQKGDPVVVTEGTFSNLKGLFVREMKDRERVMILLNEVRYQSHILIDRTFIKKAS